MSVTGLSTRGIPNSLTGLETINASYNAKFVPYVGAATTVNLGAQNITTTHQATNSFDLVNLQVLTNAIDFVNTANALTYLNKVTTNAQTVNSTQVSFQGSISASSVGVNGSYLFNKTGAFSHGWVIDRMIGTGSILKDLVFRDGETSVDCLKLSEDGQIIYVGLTCDYATANKVPIFNADKKLVSSGVDSIKITYLDNVSSDIQTQLNGKVPLVGPAQLSNTFEFTSPVPINLSGLQASKVLQLDWSKNVVASVVNTTELAYLSGVTSGVQTQLNNKVPLVGPAQLSNTFEFTSPVPITLSGLTTNRVLQLDASKNVQASSVTTTELGYVSGVTSSIQTQLNGKANTSALANYLPLTGGDISGNLTVAGTVGIGTTSVLGRCNIYFDGSTNFLTLQNATYSNGQYVSLRFMIGKNNAANVSSYIRSYVDSNDATDLRFYTDSGAGIAEQMRITDEGYVGIGITSPDVHLNVYGKGKFHNGTVGAPANGVNGADGTRLVLWPGNAGSCPYALGIDGGTLWYGTPATATHKWYNGTTNVMALDGNGNMYRSNYVPYLFTNMFVSTSGSSGSLAVCAGNEQDNAILYLGTPYSPTVSTGSAYKVALIADGNGSGTGWSTADLHFCVNGSTGSNDYTQSASLTHSRMVIKSNTAHVGIGTSAPAARLHVFDGDSSITLYGPNTTWGAYLRVGAGTNGIGSGTAQVISTNGNLHLDAGTGKDIYLNYYPSQAGSVGNIYSYTSGTWFHSGKMNIRGSADTNASLNIMNPNGGYTHFGYSNNYNYIRGALTQIDTPTRVSNWVEATEFYTNNWFRVNNNNAGLYWENLGRGIRSPEGEGNSYNTVTTIGNGRNNWSGYGIGTRYSFMKYDYSSEWGIHDNTYSWLIYGDGGSNRPVVLGGGGVRASRDWDIFVVFRNYYNFDGGYFYVNTGGGYGMASDSRIKKNIEEISQDQSITFIKNVKPASFCMQDPKPVKQTKPDGTEEEFTPSFCNCKEDGFIAQNILESAKLAGISKKVCNHWFDYEEEMKKPIEEQEVKQENILGVNDRPILSHAVNAIKYLLDKVERLEQQVATLLSR